jgi:hypothetical protein
VRLRPRHEAAERGAVIVLMALSIVMLLTMVAIVVDLGNGRQVRRGAQNAADSAALAAVQDIGSGDPEATARVYVDDNGFDGTLAEVNYPPATGEHAGDLGCIEVIPNEEVNTFFAGVIGVGRLDVAARAVACVSQQSSQLPAIFGGSTTCQNTVDWSGSTTHVIGDVHTNRDLKVGGSSNTTEGQATYVTSVDAPPDKMTYVPAAGNPTQVGVQPYPVTFDINNYKPGGSRAVAAGANYYSFTGEIDMGKLKDLGLWNDTTKTLDPGLYYATGNIKLNDSDMNGNGVTFVSATGEIDVSGSNHNLSPWEPYKLLLFSNHQKASPLSNSSNCNSPAVKMSGSTHIWGGIVYAPTGLIEMSGSTNTTLTGSLIGYTVKLSGSDLTIQSDPDCCNLDPNIHLAE